VQRTRDAMEFKWEEAGEIVHVAPLILHDALVSAIFTTGDKELDSLLQMARQQFRMPDAVIRKESLEKLWDAWEQLKTIEDPNDKRNSVAVLLDRASTEPQFRQLLEEEAKALTRAFW
jgi:hypothetical protein